MTKKIAFVSGMLGALFPVLAHAQYSAADAVNDATGLATTTASTFHSTIVVVLPILAGLIGLAWGVNKFRKYIAGKKF